jgi:hypothetical protein
MKLYTFGYDVRSTQQPATLEDQSTPTCILHAPTIQILYSSWCDLVIAHQSHPPSSPWTITYHGTSLTYAQINSIQSSSAIKYALSCGKPVCFFGSTMHDGLRGYVLSEPSHIVIFGTELDVEEGAKTIEHFCAFDDARVGGVEMDSRGGVYVGVDGGIWYLDNVRGLRDLEATSAPGERVGEVRTKQICTNATTATVLGEDGKLYTATRDPRYAKCLGRAYTGSTEFEALSYFSETCVKKISSGGYMSAAVSEDGELFIWGQANPGGGEQLAVLEEEGGKVEAGIIVEEGQDEMVKCLSVFIANEEASVYDVAVGHGHVLVAAEVQRGGGTRRRAVFGAGESGKGQLGLPSKAGFVQNFEELPAFRDVKVQQLFATAWSTFVVTMAD